MCRIKASVIIPTYNKNSRLKIVLEAFNMQKSTEGGFEVILIDDGSTDDTKLMIDHNNFDYNFKYLYQNNQGRSAARNKGIDEARGEILIFCDDDTVPSTDFINGHIKNHNKSEPCVIHGAIYDLPNLKFFKDPVNGIFYDSYGTNNENFKSLLKNILPSDPQSLSTFLDKNKRFSGFEKLIKRLFDEDKKTLQWISCTGGNFSVEKNQIKKSGTFNEQFGKRWGCEDLELGYRLYKTGTKFVYSLESANFHLTHVRGSYKDDITNAVSLFKILHTDAAAVDLENLLLGNYDSLK